MPKWVVICPFCKRQHTYAEVDEEAVGLVRAEPAGIGTKPSVDPSGERQKCPNCNREMKINKCDLTYSYL